MGNFSHICHFCLEQFRGDCAHAKCPNMAGSSARASSAGPARTATPTQPSVIARQGSGTDQRPPPPVSRPTSPRRPAVLPTGPSVMAKKQAPEPRPPGPEATAHEPPPPAPTSGRRSHLATIPSVVRSLDGDADGQNG